MKKERRKERKEEGITDVFKYQKLVSSVGSEAFQSARFFFWNLRV